MDKQNLTDCGHSESHLNAEGNEVLTLNRQRKGKFVSKNVVHLSKQKSANSKISLLSARLKFVLTSHHINNAKLKIPSYGRMLRL